MPKIKVLPEELVNQIAAGEVVERPASVVKELIENGLDAKATFLDIKIEKGGKEKIQVLDNGEGMTKKDAKLALKRYSTSKIKSVDDLNKINTFGFRGEALASIASVSKFSLKTKTKKSVDGIEIKFDQDNNLLAEACAHPTGTTIIVRDLFWNVPARQKFMKTAQTEFKHIKDFVTAQAICHPKIGFQLTHNNREVFHLPENQELSSRLISLLNLDLSQFLPIEIKADYFSLKGYIGLPEVARKKQSIQYLFINQRYLSNKIISGAIYKAYGDLLPSSIKPAYILKLNIRQDLIDVNVHPRKEEVKFISSGTIFETIKRGIFSHLSQSANSKNITYTSKQIETKGKPDGQKQQSKISFLPQRKISKPITYAEKEKFIEEIFKDESDFIDSIDRGDIWQIDNLYLVKINKHGLIIFDQHAAEERILFEKFKKDFKSQQANQQELMFEEEIKLIPEDIRLIKGHQETLETVGFKFKINKDKIIVSAVPVSLKDKLIGRVIKDYLDELKSPEEEFITKPEEPGINSETLISLAYLACRSAVKQGDKLNQFKRQQIITGIDQLGAKGMTCPHGRPTYIEISLSELNKRFKRT